MTSIFIVVVAVTMVGAVVVAVAVVIVGVVVIVVVVVLRIPVTRFAGNTSNSIRLQGMPGDKTELVPPDSLLQWFF